MLRYCVRNVLSLSNPSLRPVLLKEVASHIKCISASPGITRHFASEVNDNSKLERIYYGPLTPQIKAVKIFSLSSSVAGFLAQPIIIKQATAIGSTSLLIALCSVVGFFTFVTPLLLHIITKKYVTEIHYDSETKTYKATTINFFLVQKQLDFKVDDVVVPELPGMFTTLNAKGKPLFVEARHFNDPLHYAQMMGYDKPMDFKLGDDSQQSESK